MLRDEIESVVKKCIQQIAEEQSKTIKSLNSNQRIVEDLGFKSLDVATFTALLESELGVDPFLNNMAVITEIRTIGDVCDVYDRCINDSDSKSGSSTNSDSLDQERLQRRVGRR